MSLQNGETALHRAAMRDRAEVIKVLVDYGAAVDIRDKVTSNNCFVTSAYLCASVNFQVDT